MHDDELTSHKRAMGEREEEEEEEEDEDEREKGDKDDELELILAHNETPFFPPLCPWRQF